MSLDDLNARVTDAILAAERLPPGSREAEEAFRKVGLIEEEIAAALAVDDVEGEIARVGAVTAALSAHDPLHALLLVDRYLAVGISGQGAAKLESLRAEAEAMLDAGRGTTVSPVTFTLQAA